MVCIIAQRQKPPGDDQSAVSMQYNQLVDHFERHEGASEMKVISMVGGRDSTLKEGAAIVLHEILGSRSQGWRTRPAVILLPLRTQSAVKDSHIEQGRRILGMQPWSS